MPLVIKISAEKIVSQANELNITVSPRTAELFLKSHHIELAAKIDESVKNFLNEKLIAYIRPYMDS